jgi:uncharacterized membrane protein
MSKLLGPLYGIPVISHNPQQGGTITTVKVEGKTLQYSSPIPPPEILAAYNQVIPNAAERILTLAEEQTHHRIAIEKKFVDGETKRSNRGLFCATLIGIIGMSSAGVVGYAGHEIAAAAIAGSLMLVYGGAFIYGTKSRKEERIAKAKMMMGLTD